MKEQFSVIYSQMCVLAVSSLEAILKEYFVDSFNDKTDINIENKKLNEIKVTIRDIIDNELNFDNKLGALILERDKPNFQDLLVHKGGVVDKKFINSTKVLDANIKNYKVGDTVEIKSSDWTDMKQAFLSLLDMVTRGKAAAEIDNNGSLKDSRKGA